MHTLKTCAVSGCPRTSETPEITFFNFPRKKQIFYQWIRFVQKPVIYDLANTYICSAHFSDEDFVNDKRERLKETAVPSLVDEETLNVCIANEIYPDSGNEDSETVAIKDDMALDDSKIKYIKEEIVAYIKEEEIEYVEEPYFEVEIQDEPIFTEHDSEDETQLVEHDESSSYHAENGEIMEISVPNQLINEDTIVEISEPGLIDENTVVEIVDPNQQTAEEAIVKIKESSKSKHRGKTVKFCTSPEKKIVEVSDAQLVTPVTVTFQLCRFCTKQIDTDGIDIFAGDETSIQINEMVKVVIPGKVKEDDGLPNVMCISCVEKLKQCYDIMIMFFAADAYFRNKEFITLPRPSDYKNNNFQTEELEEEALENEEHGGLSEDELLNAIVIENSEDLEEVIILNEMEKLNGDANENEIIVGSPEKHSCTLCFKTFETLTGLILHRYTKHKVGANKGQYSCPKCPMVFSLLQALKLHVQRKHPSGNKLYVCGDCKLGFKHKHMLHNHRRNNHKKHMCDICGKSFLFAFSLQRHLENHDKVPDETSDGSKPHLCWICGKAYSMKRNLLNHIQVHFGIQIQGYPCLVCGRRLGSVAELRVHLETHKGREKVYKCSKCDKTFATKSLLQQHYLSHPTERLFMCEICGKAFKKSSTLNRHRQNHDIKEESEHALREKTGNNRNQMDLDIYECDTCNKKIVSKLSYKYHLSKHTGNKKPFDCEVCGLTFAKVQGYRTHILIHRGEFPYVCDKCGKGFRTKRTLQQHEVVHTDDRPYSCNHCHLAFKRMDSLYMHQAVHSGKRPFSCTMCGKTFVRKQDTRTHLIRYHKIHNSEVDLYILKEVEGELNDNSNFPFTQEDYFTEYISVENSLEIETT